MIETQAARPAEKRLGLIDKSLNQRRSVKLKTCADVYGQWRLYKRTYRKAPEEGVEFQIDYIDTGMALDEEARQRAPVALALHGAPGSYHDFALLIQHLTQQKVRVIAPNFPEYIATVKTKVLFRHSADEKAAYLRDFLHAIQVSTIDLLVSHSSAIFPTLLILLNANNEAIRRQQLEQQQQAAARHCAKRKQPPPSGRRGEPLTGGALHEAAAAAGHEQEALKWRTVNSDEMPSANGNGPRQVVASAAGGKQARGGGCVARYQLCDRARCQQIDEHEHGDNDNNNNEIGANSAKSSDQITAELETANKKNLHIHSHHHQHRHNNNERNHTGSDSLLDDDAVTNSKASAPEKPRRGRKTDVVVKFKQAIEIKAVALLNPAGHRMPKSMKPTWYKCGSVHVYQHKLGRSIFRKFGPAFLTVVGVPVRVDNMDNVMLSATVMRNSKCQRVGKQLEQLEQMKIPTLLVFSENDKLIEKEIFYEMTQFMKLDPRNFDVFNNDGDIELAQSSMHDWIRVMVFKAGGHYAYSNYAKTVNQAVSELLEKVRTNTSPNDSSSN